ncbi:hypothetical protein QSI_2458 [Clostridioides difficile P28]|nr:hypothetical protein QSI_2458 [Clostridioides difficile P28]
MISLETAEKAIKKNIAGCSRDDAFYEYMNIRSTVTNYKYG